MTIHDFLLMPTLDGSEVREEPHGLDTTILQRVVSRTTQPVPQGTAIPEPTVEETIATRADPGVVAKAKNTAKRKASTQPEVSTDATKRKVVIKKNSKVGVSGQAATTHSELSKEVNKGEFLNVIPLRTFNSRIGLDVIHPPIILPDKRVSDAPHAESSVTLRETTHSSSRGAPGKLLFPCCLTRLLYFPSFYYFLMFSLFCRCYHS